MEMLILSLVMILLAPLCYFFLQRYGKVFFWLDRAVFGIVAILVAVELLPEVIEQAGYGAIVLALLGWLVPFVFERHWHSLGDSVRKVPLVLAIMGLVVHGFLDGIGLYEGPGVGHEGHLHVLPYTIVLHQLPVAVFVWWLLYPHHGPRLPTFCLFLLGASSILGFLFANSVISGLGDNQYLALFQAVVAGSLLHLAMHDHRH